MLTPPAEHLIRVGSNFVFVGCCLRRRRTLKGQVLILALLVLLGVVLVFVLLSHVSVRVQATPTVQEAVWLVDDQEVSFVRL